MDAACPRRRVRHGMARMLFGAFIRAALQRAGDAQGRRNYPLFIDEVQVFFDHNDASDFALALSQLRGFGIPTAYFHQAFTQLGPYRELMQINAGSRIIMRTKYPDSNDHVSGEPLHCMYAVVRL